MLGNNHTSYDNIASVKSLTDIPDKTVAIGSKYYDNGIM
jgi:hypothetical protein